MRRAALVAGLVLSLGMAACGDGGGGGSDSPAASTAGVTIDMVDLEFRPKSVTVDRGATVTFVNRGKVTHNAKGDEFFSRVVDPGESYRHEFDSAGTFEYVCTFHPGMDGTIRVR